MSFDKKCKYCGTEMKEIRQDTVANTTYHYMKCEKCHNEVARREE